MTEDQVSVFMKSLGSKQVVRKDNWMSGTCVLARWTHKSGKDSNPSFGMTFEAGKTSRFNCFSCRTGSAEELLGAIEMFASQSAGTFAEQGLDIKTARKMLEEEEIGLVALPEYGEFTQTPQHEFQEWPQYWVDSFAPASNVTEAYDYLRSRDVTDEQIKQFNIRWDSNRKMVVFPYKNVYGKFAGARGRAVVDNVKGSKKHHDYTWNGVNNASLCWFNEQCLDSDGKVIIVEGQFDAMRVSMVYPKVIGNMTAKPSLNKLRRLQQTDGVVYIPDNDEAGEQATVRYAEYCKNKGIPFETVHLDSSVKDAAECHPEYLKTIFSDANII